MKKSHQLLLTIVIVSVSIVGFKSSTQSEAQYEYATITIAEPLNRKDVGYILIIQSGGTSQIKFSGSELDEIESKANYEMNQLGINGFQISTSVQNVVNRVDTNNKSASYLETTYTFIKE